MTREEIVSHANEELILVDEDDREIGCRPKRDCHAGAGILHRGFSVFVFNGRGEVLLQERSAEKPLWPNRWSNSCCSHPRFGEPMDEAVSRRLLQELGFACSLSFLYKFKYHARYGSVGAEREYCWVYHGRHDGELDVNRREVAAWRFVDPAALDAEVEDLPARFTPWFRMEWAHIRGNFLSIASGRTR